VVLIVTDGRRWAELGAAGWAFINNSSLNKWFDRCSFIPLTFSLSLCATLQSVVLFFCRCCRVFIIGAILWTFWSSFTYFRGHFVFFVFFLISAVKTRLNSNFWRDFLFLLHPNTPHGLIWLFPTESGLKSEYFCPHQQSHVVKMSFIVRFDKLKVKCFNKRTNT